jgi:hypothetical protein
MKIKTQIIVIVMMLVTGMGFASASNAGGWFERFNNLTNSSLVLRNETSEPVIFVVDAGRGGDRFVAPGGSTAVTLHLGDVPTVHVYQAEGNQRGGQLWGHRISPMTALTHSYGWNGRSL